VDPERVRIKTETEMRAFGASLVHTIAAGDTVFLYGELGAGKTTLVRGYLEALGHRGPVRSPTFNLVQIFPTEPPVVHVDLYRVKSHEGLGLEDNLDDHVTFVEWADRAAGLIEQDQAWIIKIEFAAEGRVVIVVPAHAAPHS
jgi:tRNA threonylcarbamoyladenosine biosynthesis protein TsaE